MLSEVNVTLVETRIGTPHAQDTQRTISPLKDCMGEWASRPSLCVEKRQGHRRVSVTAPVNTEPWHSSLAKEGDS